MGRPSFSEYSFCGIAASAVVTANVAESFESPEGGPIHPVRDFDLLILPDFFNHAGNCINGTVAALGVMYAGLAALERQDNENNSTAIVAATAGLAGAAATSVNFAYEAGVYIPPFPQKPPEAPLDTADALYGSVTGVLLSALFAYSALRHKFKRKPRQQSAVAVTG